VKWWRHSAHDFRVFSASTTWRALALTILADASVSARLALRAMLAAGFSLLCQFDRLRHDSPILGL
jgi:hypothetical protein